MERTQRNLDSLTNRIAECAKTATEMGLDDLADALREQAGISVDIPAMGPPTDNRTIG